MLRLHWVVCAMSMLAATVAGTTVAQSEISLLTGDGGMDCVGTIGDTYSNIGYAMRGYNSIRANSMASGHDPGFALQIFKAEYSGAKSSDCRYQIPAGYDVMSDVSCVTSFDSKDISKMTEYQDELTASASLEASGWGASFSASAEYKEFSSEISGGNYVYIISSASCTNYYARLIESKPPQFTDFFKTWVKLLDTNTTKYLSDFIELFGNQYVETAYFGARFSLKNRMDATTYIKDTNNKVDIDMAASYSGAFSIGGGAHYDDSQKKLAQDFSKKVKTTSVSVGATPPANGDANTWASEVKNDPIPMKYKLRSIEELFTDKFMKNLGVSHATIKSSIVTNKLTYCKKLLAANEVTSCS